MFVIAIDDREYRVQLGDGWANEYLDEDNIKDYAFNDSLTDMLRDGSYYGGIKSVVQQTIGLAGLSINVQPRLQSYVSAAEKWENNKEEEEENGKNFVIMFVLMLAGAALIYFGAKPIKATIVNRRISKILKLLEVELAFNEDLETLPQTREELAESFEEEKVAINEQNLTAFLSKEAEEYKARQEALKIKREKGNFALQLVLRSEELTADLSVTNNQLANAMVESELELTQENADVFIKHFKNNSRLLSHQKNAEYFDKEEQALEITKKTPYTAYGSNIYEQLLFYNLLSSTYRSTAWYSSPEYQAEQAAAEAANTSSDNFSGFSGGGASGSW